MYPFARANNWFSILKNEARIDHCPEQLSGILMNLLSNEASPEIMELYNHSGVT